MDDPTDTTTSAPAPGPVDPIDVDVLVVGAGVAGLIAARDLQAAGARVVVVDKGRGVGGRLATRRLADAALDHGAQFVSAHDPAFATELAAWVAAGAAAPWFTDPATGVVRHRGVPAMTGIAKHLAAGLDVRTGVRVAGLDDAAPGWRAAFEDAATPAIGARAVVVTAPAPQALDLFAAGALAEADHRRLAAIDYHPCVAALVVLDHSPGWDPPAGAGAGPLAWYADNQAKGVSARPAVTLHATPEASVALWDRADDDVVAELVGALPGHLALDLDDHPAVAAQVQRWRYSLTRTADPAPYLALAGPAPAVVAGDGFGRGGRVEAAALSGAAAAAHLVAALGLGA